jgi:hypothetical protein
VAKVNVPSEAERSGTLLKKLINVISFIEKTGSIKVTLFENRIQSGKKEASLGGDVSEYIRANTTTLKQVSITTTSGIMIQPQGDM